MTEEYQNNPNRPLPEDAGDASNPGPPRYEKPVLIRYRQIKKVLGYGHDPAHDEQ